MHVQTHSTSEDAHGRVSKDGAFPKSTCETGLTTPDGHEGLILLEGGVSCCEEDPCPHHERETQCDENALQHWHLHNVLLRTQQRMNTPGGEHDGQGHDRSLNGGGHGDAECRTHSLSGAAFHAELLPVGLSRNRGGRDTTG